MDYESKFVDIQAIKSLNIKQIEDEFAKALQVLTGNLYKVNINKLDIDDAQNISLMTLNLTSDTPF